MKNDEPKTVEQVGAAVPAPDQNAHDPVALAERLLALPGDPSDWRTEDRTLMCRLTADEQRDRGLQLATALADLRDLEREKRHVAEAIKGAEATVERLSDTVRHCQEGREVKCYLVPDYERDTMTVVRTDTAETVYIRQLTFDERQQPLPGLEPPPEADPVQPPAADAPPCQEG